ncbi:hypothetical protein SERLA73DRAFT_72184 [Serpula lacrymans var. lacrymans S7.3]|uniref:Uncharacterized protein n=1 Tax=Serpula lacrymans var. lacrymans (strain S7.3) TaxID=936435 RepID=F8PS45_SERL3|nr:hypothetical protein SERLA73DRAFT_72184 [Serpula lacrymans var. lacrymans S7.3]
MFASGLAGALVKEMDGSSDENPIILEQLPCCQFDIFLAVYTSRYHSLTFTNNKMVDLLCFSSKYLCVAAQNLAIHHISTQCWSYSDITLASIAVQYGVRTWFKHAFAHLVEVCLSQFTPAKRRLLGHPIFIAIATLHEIIYEHRCIVACEPPELEEHALDCSNHDRCTSDWAQVWWNRMGQFILDGRNPLSYKEASQRFQKFKFGWMVDGCKKKMFEVIWSNKAFGITNELIKETAVCLEKEHIFEPCLSSDDESLGVDE